MGRMNARARAVAAVVVVGAAAFSLTGCFANPLDGAMEKIADEGSSNAVEGLVEKATGGDVDVELGSIPEDFPDSVPLVTTDVVHSVSIDNEDGRGIALTVADPRGPEEVAEEVRADFGDWEEGYWSGGMGMFNGQFSSDGVMVIVGVIEDGEGSNVQYMTYFEQANK